MSRLPIAAFAALVVATVGAFFVTQHLKVSTPLYAGFPHPYPAAINPYETGCKGFNRMAKFSFYLLHRADDVAVYVVDPSGTIIRTLSTRRHMRVGVRDPDGLFPWNGREDNGSVAPDGTYYFRIALLRQGRTSELTKDSVTVKTVPPRPVVTNVSPTLIPERGAPVTIQFRGSEGRGVTVRVYRTDFPTGPRLVKSFFSPWKGPQTSWDGRIRGLPAPTGTYLVGIDVTDNVCETGHFPPVIPPAAGSAPHAGFSVRYLAAQPQLDPAAAGSRTLVYVDSRHHRYQWTLQRVGARAIAAHRSEAARNYALRFRVPAKGPGLYVLSLRSGAHRTAVPVIVRALGSAHPPRILVVLPALSWQGMNPVDDPPDYDGIPNTLSAGGPINLQRVLVNGLPAGFADEAALLAYLDRSHLPYDLTTDLALIDGSGPLLSGHGGVVLAGSEQWLPSSVSSALRSYVQSGGHVLSLGIDSLRRGVTVRGTEALDPTAPSVPDAFGARAAPLVVHSTDLVTVIHDGLGIFSSTSGAFQGYSAYQPITPPAPSAGQSGSAAGTSATTAAIVGFKLGNGLVVEVGLPGFASSLARNVDAQELIRRLWTVLAP